MALPPIPSPILWPDPLKGPWYVEVWWRPQHGTLVPVGIEMRSWIPSGDEGMKDTYGSELPAGDEDIEFPVIGSQFMKALPIGQLLRASRESLQEILELESPPPGWKGKNFDQVHRFLQAEYGPAVQQAQRSGRDLGADHYATVAKVYSEAVRTGAAPTKAVADAFTLSRSAAAKQVARARERGFLPRTTRGRVGKLTEDL